MSEMYVEVREDLSQRQAQMMGDAITRQANKKLHAARYAFHAIVRHKYREAMRRDAMTLEEAQERYRKAMENYDGIVENALSGNSHDANEADMAKGFTDA